MRGSTQMPSTLVVMGGVQRRSKTQLALRSIDPIAFEFIAAYCRASPHKSTTDTTAIPRSRVLILLRRPRHTDFTVPNNAISRTPYSSSATGFVSPQLSVCIFFGLVVTSRLFCGTSTPHSCGRDHSVRLGTLSLKPRVIQWSRSPKTVAGGRASPFTNAGATVRSSPPLPISLLHHQKCPTCETKDRKDRGEHRRKKRILTFVPVRTTQAAEREPFCS
ncbi:hypothetical protein BJ322DRAFT_719755 [Thelephora terrestris]|uniref:Uncharacterized protein n=1 Tax=Thelephora terrestris TaxID=56493 RepID=A0A9P6HJC3_9AGAM|nr:hypothetical protein BJ322DRAFT_719755 [Thelephora terrestris]